jgi:hypothetical protein
MFKYAILTLLVFGMIEAFAQSPFATGFNQGFKVGYCYNRGIQCIPPLPPIAPLPNLRESRESYIDGYNKGLLMGLNRANESQYSYSAGNTAIFQNAPIIPETPLYKPDFTFYSKAMSQADAQYRPKSTEVFTGDISDELSAASKAHHAPEKVKMRKEYRAFILKYFEQLEDIPRIPTGVHEAIHMMGDINVATVMVTVDQNKIVAIVAKNITGEDQIIVDPSYYPTNKNPKIHVIIPSAYIDSGKSKFIRTLYLDQSDEGYPMPLHDELYFLDYITTYKKTQIQVKKLREQYLLIKTHPIIQDGWHLVFAYDGEGFFEQRSVFVQSGKVVVFKRGDGNNQNIENGTSISNSKTTISYLFDNPLSKAKENIFLEIFFMK